MIIKGRSHKMRIIAGTYKNIRLISPKGQAIRPTSDRVREWIFSCLIAEIRGAHVLDLFAGTGAFGLEALSRGAGAVTFVDCTKQAFDLTKMNLTKTGALAPVVKNDAISFLTGTLEQYDIIFCDPPYKYDQFGKLVEIIQARNLLAQQGILIYETDRHESRIELSGFCRKREKTLSRTRVVFYQYEL